MEPVGREECDMAKEWGEPLAIVGIGASAGGLEAFEQFFMNMPPDTGIAFVLITHMDPTKKGLLPEILRRFTSMPVRETRDGMKVEANTVYVKPAQADLSIFHGTIGHLRPIRTGGLRMPIDGFFQHLAEDQNRKAVGIVLSGTGSDGTLGIRAIKEHTGMVMAQDPGSARFNGMPSSAIASGFVDYTAPADELPELLIQYVRFSVMVPAGEALTTAVEEADLAKIFTLIRLRTGQDFSRYKRSTIRRRIERRMAIHQTPSIREYVQFLHANPPEIDTLAGELLIGVTRFFRDSEAWVALEGLIQNEMIPSRSEKGVIRAWSVGCSTGEEAYSLAIVLRECLDALRRPDAIQIFATDVDKKAIEVARRGTYPVNIAADMPPERLERFFIKEENTYRVRKEIRDSVIFATQNVISDPPFTHLDILSCRNLLIYLSLDLQKQLIPLFQYALNPGGLLFLGTAESIGGFDTQFRTVESRWKIFQRREGTPAQAPRLELAATFTPPVAAQQRQREFARGEEAIAALSREWLLEEYAPPALIVNENGDILYFHGRTGDYLEPHPGRASLNIQMMTRREIRDALEPVLRAAVREKENFIQEAIPVYLGDDRRQILLTVRPIGRRGDGMLYIVVFQDEEGQGREVPIEGDMVHGSSAGPSAAGLKQEIARIRFHLRHTIEDMQASHEELKAMNEELQSTNEELQSTNEGLTTSKEELQSLNEELLTVNAEHQKKIEELSQGNDDMRNLLQSTELAMLFLDNDLGVRRFTEPIRSVINLQAGDVGRSITDLAVNLKDEHLIDDLRDVLKTLQLQEREVQTTGGMWFDMRILPYRTAENRIDGLVITFTDISPRKELESSIRKTRACAEGIVATVREPLAVLSSDLRVIAANRSFSTIFGITPKETEGRLIYTLGNRQWNTPGLHRLLLEIMSGKGEIEGFDIELGVAGLGRRTMLLNVKRVYSEAGEDRILLAARDITGRPVAESRRREGNTA